MTGIGSSNRTGHGVPVASSAPTSAPVSLGQRFDALFDNLIDFMTKVLCRASRGYLCPPDMTHVMYPDETRPPNFRPSYSPSKECCDEKLPGK
jgi:hypothetical protein